MSQEQTSELSLPLHRRVAQYIHEEIAQKGLVPHTKIPSEVALARQYGVSHGTITKALETLVHKGVLYRRRPQGTFVAPPETALEKSAMGNQQGKRHPDVSTNHKHTSAGIHTGVSGQTTPSFIGLLVPRMADTFLHHSVLGVEAMTRAAGYGLSFAYSEEDWGLERYHIEQFLRQEVVGMIIFPSDFVVQQLPDGRLASVESEERINTLHMLQERNIPFVLLDRYVPEVECSYVVSDDFSAGYAVTHHLAALGHQRIAFLTVTQRVTSCINRYNGYRKCMQNHQLACDDSLLLQTLWQKKAWTSSPAPSFYALGSEDLEQVCEFLRQPQRPTAIVAMNDYVALLVLQAAEQVGITIPEELALACCGGTDFGIHPRVPLTTIMQPTAEMGRLGAQIALDLIARRISGIRQVSLPVSLMVRKSSGAEESKIALIPPSQDEHQQIFP